MQIIIKQSEIEVAVKNYIAGLGINLAGKDVEVSFTAGRKEDGLSASLDIVDATLGTVVSVPPKPVIEAAAPAAVVQAISQTSPAKTVHVSRAQAVDPEPVQAQEFAEDPNSTQPEAPVAEVEAANDVEVQPAKKVNSLFG